MKFLFVMSLLIAGTSSLFAQQQNTKADLKGIVTDQSKSVLINATVLLSKENGKSIKRTFSDEFGHFKIEDVPTGNYVLVVKYIGYKTEQQRIQVKPDHDNYMEVQLSKSGLNLSQINVSAIKPLITITKDTITFDANQIQVKENANVKKLFEKIPGLFVDSEGKYYFRGRLVKDVKIDGRSNFRQGENVSADPHKIEDMIRADLIAKVQVIDRRNPDGTVDKEGEKTINLVLKAEARNRINGKVTGGIGIQDTYQLVGNLNKFSSKRHVMAMARSNNCNSDGNTSFNPLSVPVSGRYSVSGVDANLSTDLSEKLKFSGLVSYAHQNVKMTNSLQRQNFLQDSSYLYNSEGNNTREDQIYTVNMLLDYARSAKTQYSLGVSLSKKDNFTNTANTYAILAPDTLNSGTVNSRESSTQYLGKIYGTVKHTFSPKSMLYSTIKYQSLQQTGNQFNISTAHQQGANVSQINQNIHPTIQSADLEVQTQYTYRISNFSVGLQYLFDYNVDRNQQKVSDYSATDKNYTIPNDSLSFRFNNYFFNQQLRTTFGYQKKKWEGLLGLGYSLVDAANTNFSTGNKYNYQLGFFAPNLTIDYKAGTTNLRFSVESKAVPVPVTELAPVNDLKNPNFIKVGNPDLEASRSTSVTLGGMGGNRRGVNYFLSVIASLNDNAITSSITVDSLGRQISKSVNCDGVYNLGFMGSFGAKVKNFGYNYQFSADRRNNVSYIDGLKNNTTQHSIRNTFLSTWTKGDLDLSLMGYILYVSSRYAVQQNRVYDYMNYSVSISGSYTLFGFELGGSTSYYNNTASEQQYAIVNAWLAKSFLKKSLEGKLNVFDIFRQNQSVKVIQTATAIETSISNVLPQYFMCSLSYYIGKRPVRKQPFF